MYDGQNVTFFCTLQQLSCHLFLFKLHEIFTLEFYNQRVKKYKIHLYPKVTAMLSFLFKLHAIFTLEFYNQRVKKQITENIKFTSVATFKSLFS